MKLTRRFLAVATSLIFGAAYLIGPLDPTSTYAGLTSTDPKSSLALAPPDMPQATFADLWRVDRSFQSTIHMKNLLTFRPVQVTPALYMSDGTEYDLPSVTLAASGMADLDVNQALADAPPNIASHVSQFGSAALKYKHFGSGVVAGEITMLDVPRSLVFSSPFQMMMSTTGMVGMTPAATTQTLEGLWWRHDPNMGGYVNVSNTTDHPVQVSTQVMGAHGAALAPETISLNPHGEQILDLNALTFGVPKSQNQAGSETWKWAADSKMPARDTLRTCPSGSTILILR